MLLQNSTLKGGNVDYTYKKPFNIFAKGLNHLVNLGQDVEVRTFEITKWFINNIKNIDFIAFNQILKAIMI